MSAISPRKFYNEKIISEPVIQRVPSWVKKHRKMPSHILGPPNIWKEFGKQEIALVTAFEESTIADMLCTFVYQGDNGYRKFVVAHPEVYWWHYEHRPAEERCSYEVIPENYPCRLYLDLEYLIELNPESNGPTMTDTIIEIICAYLLNHYGLPCNKYNVVNMDSSTTEKFSRHVIFNIKHIGFKDNFHVGRLVKSICQDVQNYISTKDSEHNILRCFDRTKLEQLLVKTPKGNCLFIDTSVYTKNRHFRIYKSTKWGKQSNLEISKDCKYIPSNLYKDKELNIFVDSLVTYFNSKSDLILLEYGKVGTVEAKRFRKRVPRFIRQGGNNRYSKYPLLDKYVNDKIHPGKIRLCKHYPDNDKVLIYETTGYRFCENIGKCHKSNNVFLIVDLTSKMIYQKCHDEDCSGFKSEPKQLPEEVSFQINDGDDMLLSCVPIEEITKRRMGNRLETYTYMETRLSEMRYLRYTIHNFCPKFPENVSRTENVHRHDKVRSCYAISRVSYRTISSIQKKYYMRVPLCAIKSNLEKILYDIYSRDNIKRTIENWLKRHESFLRC